ncbi:hypothetical protein AS9A_0693 [Hoyosella subflava DQS3-9A1]|uniref:Uncharacterized protein n=1 Tax=Hoyosella subflava (strain DSM 45089 / JCM 17490 / NBRC 109087 / DQS3-9A1) TaxID=443218 RepID=F6EKH6_HOYSD|nr:hypothetical protein AS9A_0693 [Hoyosella subflava DQS3-9A1]
MNRNPACKIAGERPELVRQKFVRIGVSVSGGRLLLGDLPRRKDQGFRVVTSSVRNWPHYCPG